ncbi:inorganic phosphate transporter, partial [Streptomyces sp. SID8361]|nr:inorganic phosphate transporter [Streptomyces sp. SID8361]
VNEVAPQEPVGAVTAALRSVAPPPAGTAASAPEGAAETAAGSGTPESAPEQTPTPAAASSTTR